MIERLDRTRFQPWFVYYPTALPLDLTGAAVHRWVQRLYSIYGFSRLLVVGHSMGGLVGRAFINDAVQHADGGLADTLRLFVTLSTPWQGHSMAALGVQHAPAVAPSWHDMAPDSAFLRAVLAQPLPSQIPYYLLFSYSGGSRMLGEANDGVVTLTSELDPRAQQQAVKVYGFAESHGGILGSASVSVLVNGLMTAAAH